MTDEERRIPATTHTFRKFVVWTVAILALLILLLLMLGRLPRLAAPEPEATATRRPTTVAEAVEPATDTPLPTPTVLPPTHTPPPTETEAPPTASATPSQTPGSELGTPPRPATLTATPLPPTPTTTRAPSVTLLPPSPTATRMPSATPVPPTAQPTATATNVPPTATATGAPAIAPLRIDTPVAGASVPQGRLQISGVAQSGAQVQVIDGGEVIATTNANSGGGWTVVLGQGLEPGSHELRAQAIDANGGVEAQSDPVPLTVVEMVVPTSGSDQLPWSAMLLVATALAGLALIFVLAGATLHAWERTRRR